MTNISKEMAEQLIADPTSVEAPAGHLPRFKIAEPVTPDLTSFQMAEQIGEVIKHQDLNAAALALCLSMSAHIGLTFEVNDEPQAEALEALNRAHAMMRDRIKQNWGITKKH